MPTQCLRIVVASALLACCFAADAGAQAAGGTRTGAAASSDPKDRQIRELREHVRKLETRLAKLEERLDRMQGWPDLRQQPGATEGDTQPTDPAAPDAGGDAPAGAAVQATEEQRKKLVARARQRMRLDSQKYSKEQLAEAEGLYQVANSNWRSDEAKESLRQMVKKFPDVNRTGCAVLYLGQMAEGEEKEKLLTEATTKYADCFFGNGVQVGAYARYLLGLHYKNLGQDDKAKQLFDEIRRKYPEAVGHRGELLAQRIPRNER